MRRFLRSALLLWAALPAFAQTSARVELAVAPALPSAALAAGASAGLSPSFSFAPTAALAAPSLPAPVLSAPLLGEVPAAVPVAAAPRAAFAATGNGLIATGDKDAALKALRDASWPMHAETSAVIARIKAAHPGLPISADNLFLIKDPDALKALELPEDAGGAARIVSDGRSETPIVILAAPKGLSLDSFVEFAVHEAVHLMDDGILRVAHDQELKHYFAEGWTQLRAVAIANRVLAELGRPATPGNAYHREIALVEAFRARHGDDALDELVTRGSDAGLRRALGDRWDLAARLVAGDEGRRPASREKRLNALIALVNADSVGPADERALLDYASR